MDNKNNQITYIGIERLHPHPDNPRKNLGDLSELSESIKANGVMQNLTVVPSDQDGEYTVIIGHRRHAAAKLAGLSELPCMISDMDYKNQIATMLLENIQRNDLTVYEQAQGFQMMMNLGETPETISEKTGFSKTTVQHRLNIAKLDQTLLKEKENDGGFQLSLSDLYELEKIEDINTRNKVLKESYSSQDLSRRAIGAVQDEKRDKHLQTLIKLFKKLGIKENKGAQYELYNSKWEILKEVDLDIEPPEDLNLKPGETFWCRRYSSEIAIFRKSEKKEKPLTEAEKKRAELDARKKKLSSIKSAACKEIGSFIVNVAEGRIAPVDDKDLNKTIWDFLVAAHAYVGKSNIIEGLMETDFWKLSPQEQKDAAKKVKKMGLTSQMLLLVPISISRTSLIDYNGKYMTGAGEAVSLLIEILSAYGFEWSSPEFEQVMTGTSELYTKEDKK